MNKHLFEYENIPDFMPDDLDILMKRLETQTAAAHKSSERLIAEATALFYRSWDAAHGIFPRAEDRPEEKVYKTGEVHTYHATRR